VARKAPLQIALRFRDARESCRCLRCPPRGGEGLGKEQALSEGPIEEDAISRRAGGARAWAALLLGAGLLLAGCDQDQGQSGAPAEAPPPEVTVAKPVVKEIVEDDEFVGRFAAVSEVEVRARVSGYLEAILFEDGEIVKAGDPLFTIDPRPFVTALNQAQAEIDSATAEVSFTRSELTRAEQLITRGNISQQALDERRQAHHAAQARLAAGEAALERARLDLEYTQIRAPLAGRIDRNYISEGNLVEASETVLTNIVSTDPIYFYFDIDERSFLAYASDARERGADLHSGEGGLPVTVRVADERYPPFDGRLDFSENRIDPDSGTMRLRAVIPNPDLVLQPGLFGRINIPGSLPYEGILIPDEAIASDQNRRIVYLVDDQGRVSAKEVRPGPSIDGYRVIRDGLTGEETIVVKGLLRVRPGVTVKPQLIELPPRGA
jgi:multidrug efflux system membrane fusion protein